MNPRDTLYLQHILDASETIERYLISLSEEQFQQETLYQDAIIRQLEVIGEAVKQLSEELCSRYPQIPWRSIAGMRDRLIHHYFRVDLNQVWLTATTDIPVLKQVVSQALHQEPSRE